MPGLMMTIGVEQRPLAQHLVTIEDGDNTGDCEGGFSAWFSRK